MKTVNSLSGGKTSSYLAVHYPADLNVFALVCIDDHNAGRRIDKKIKQMVNDRLQKYCSHWPEFRATAEDPKTLNVIFDLEQMIGREITWLRGMGWEQMVRTKKAIPNMEWRFCTSELKMRPIFEHLYLYHELPVKMRVGYRYDEQERQNGFTDTFEFSPRCEYRATTKVHRWEEIVWRVGEFPLIEDKVFHGTIRKFWQRYPIDFPEDSNCQNCFWKQPQQLRKNFDTNPDIMRWAMVLEEINGSSFRKNEPLIQTRELGLQLDFFFGTGSGCQAGFCTD